MYKNLIWDLDGTLLDSFGVFESVLSEVLPAHGIVVPQHETMLANFHGTLSDSIDNAVGGTSKEQLESVMTDFLLVQDGHYEVVEDHLFSDALRLVLRAHKAGCRQIIVTNREHEGRLNASPRRIVSNSSLSNYIEKVVCGDDSSHRKPKPAVLGALAIELDPLETLVIGDQHVDIAFARNLRADSVLVARGTEPDYSHTLGIDWREFTTVVTSLDEIMT